MLRRRCRDRCVSVTRLIDANLGRATLVSLAMALTSAASASAADLGGYVHRTVQAPYRFLDTIVRLHFDIGAGIVYGRETAIISAKGAMQDIPFNTSGIHYRSITVSGIPSAYAVREREERLTIRLAKPVTAGKRLRIDFDYWAKPRRGLYFIRPDKSYPNETPQIWTQGEPTDNRAWFPTWDQPNEKTPSELIVSVPHGWTVIGNGYLKTHTRLASHDVWDWAAPRRKSTYLIAFAAGPLVEWHDALGRLSIDSFVKPPLAPFNAQCFRETKAMVAFYQQITGTPFPFAKYDQIAAERFIFGGMEDASDTIVTEVALHPAIEEAENPCDRLVAHELAQHWYGDDATMADWADIWLNEGFATYYDELWTEHRFGVPDFEYARYNAQQAYFSEAQLYQRPIVDYKYANPLQDVDRRQQPRTSRASPPHAADDGRRCALLRRRRRLSARVYLPQRRHASILQGDRQVARHEPRLVRKRMVLSCVVSALRRVAKVRNRNAYAAAARGAAQRRRTPVSHAHRRGSLYGRPHDLHDGDTAEERAGSLDRERPLVSADGALRSRQQSLAPANVRENHSRAGIPAVTCTPRRRS